MKCGFLCRFGFQSDKFYFKETIRIGLNITNTLHMHGVSHRITLIFHFYLLVHEHWTLNTFCVTVRCWSVSSCEHFFFSRHVVSVGELNTCEIRIITDMSLNYTLSTIFFFEYKTQPHVFFYFRCFLILYHENSLEMICVLWLDDILSSI